MDGEQFKAELARLNDGAEAQKLAIKIADLIKNGDSAGLSKLGTQIEEKDGDMLEYVAGYPDGLPQDIALSITPCQYANLVIRAFAITVSNDTAKPVIRDGIIMIDGSDIDTTFSENMWRCETISGLQHKTEIGSKCAMTGAGCLEDPDLN